ncbi:MAG: dihydrodipicolinate synthase family protein [Spirochaetales bacterium]|nr:dihydrodipicolinate synthase family protein [Spirochaetales bacterium]
MNHKLNLSGVFTPVVTPFEKDEIRLDWLAENLQKAGETELKGYLALGSNGEFMSLSESEQLDVIKTFVVNKKGKVLMTGTARESVKETIEFSKKAIELGSDYISVLSPHYFAKKMNDEVLYRYYSLIADALTVPVLLYNAPGFASGVMLSNSLVSRLADHPNIIGMKDSSPSGMNGYLAAVQEKDFHILAGSANFYYSALSLGAVGGIISLANALPELCCDFHEAVVTGNSELAVREHYRIFRLNQAVSGKYGVAGVKASMNITGYKGGEPRQPLEAVNAEQSLEMKAFFEKMNVL